MILLQDAGGATDVLEVTNATGLVIYPFPARQEPFCVIDTRWKGIMLRS
jgi:hypothetical protein